MVLEESKNIRYLLSHLKESNNIRYLLSHMKETCETLVAEQAVLEGKV